MWFLWLVNYMFWHFRIQGMHLPITQVSGELKPPDSHYVWRMYYVPWWVKGYKYTVTTLKYVEGGPDRKAPEVVWNTSSYI